MIASLLARGYMVLQSLYLKNENKINNISTIPCALVIHVYFNQLSQMKHCSSLQDRHELLKLTYIVRDECKNITLSGYDRLTYLHSLQRSFFAVISKRRYNRQARQYVRRAISSLSPYLWG